MKKILAILCVIGLITSTATSALAATTSSTKLIPTNIPKTFPVIKQDASFTTVNFWHAMTGTLANNVSEMANWYNATQGKKTKTYVKAIFQGDYDAITIKLQATLQSGKIKDLPDIAQLSAQGFFSVKESKNVVVMGDLIAEDKSFNILDKLDKAAMYSCSYKGKQLGMPFSNSVIVLHYNANAFKSVGLDPNNPPKTMADYTDAALKLMIKGTGSKPKRYGGNNKIYSFQLNTWIPRQKGGTANQFDMENGRLGVPTKYACAYDGTLKATLTEWGKALQSGAVDFNSNAISQYQQGLSCMFQGSIIQYESTLTALKQYKGTPKYFETKMCALPVINPNDLTAEHTAGSAIYMFERGDDARKLKAWDFVKFLASPDVSAYWYIKSGYFPLNNDALNTKYVQDVIKAYPEKNIPLKIREESAKYYKFQAPLVPSAGVYDALIGDQSALLGQKKITVDQAVTNIQKKAEALLKTYWDANK